MSEDNQIIKIENVDLGTLTKPATVLIQKISDAVGGYFKPYQMKRVAKAKAEVDVIEAKAEIKVTDIQRRALSRFVKEETKKQINIERITQMAVPLLEDDSKPQDVEDDWITNFFDKCRIVSDDEMQSLWAKLLAGEANSPKTYSKRTVNLLGSLDKSEAQLFTSLCGFIWIVAHRVTPLIFDYEDRIYKDRNIRWATLSHLDDIGLINFNSLTGFSRTNFPKMINTSYYGTHLNFEFKKPEKNDLDIGYVKLTMVGEELFPICGSKPVNGFEDYIIDYLARRNIILSSPYPRIRLSKSK